MKDRTPEHIAVWLENSRRSLVALNETLKDLPVEERLKAIQSQYALIAQLKKVFSKDAYFVGIPNRKGVL